MSAQTILTWLAIIFFIIAAVLSIWTPDNPKVSAIFFLAVGLALWAATGLAH